ncbi:hypothetical protein M9Y10_010752 [Tritrichomonas musculus]|uniref:Surface antigen BspA-like n=1 Tax=Tritrichomonas musculus TaxID=1915356 RepID=A0ABR2ILQ0_9EUKA
MIRIETNGLVLSLDQNTHTAHLNHISRKDKEEVVIPKSVKYQKKEYIITDIKRSIDDFGQSRKVKSISFANNTKVTCIHKDSFSGSVLERISIPACLECLEDGWCSEANRLKYIKISPGNKNYIYIDNKMLLGKSDTKSDIYDILSFVRRDVKEIKIPSFIKYIHSSCFDQCRSLKTIEIPDDSELFSIGNCAFAMCPITRFFIPAKLQRLEYGWCDELFDVKEFIISPQNKLFATINNNKVLVSKASENDDNYTILKYVMKDVERIIVPSYIQSISSYAFECNSKLKSVEFEKNSQLEIIESYAFFAASIREIEIPASVIRILKNAFDFCSLLTKMTFESNSNLSFIGSDIVNTSRLTKVVIPASVKNIGNSAFNCSTITEFIFEENSNLCCLNCEVCPHCKIESLLIPASIKSMNYSFPGCNKLVSVEILSQVISIEDLCFSECESLRVASIPNGESISIDDNAFVDVSADFSLFVCPGVKVNIDCSE